MALKSNTISIDPYVVVWHRNHPGVLSGTSPQLGTGDIYYFDFSTDLTQAYGGGVGYKLIEVFNYVKRKVSDNESDTSHILAVKNHRETPSF